MKKIFFVFIGTLIFSTNSFATDPIKKNTAKDKIENVNCKNASELDVPNLNSLTDDLTFENRVIETPPEPKSVICWIAWVFNKYCVD